MNLVDTHNGMPVILSSVFHHAVFFYTGYLEVQPLATLVCTIIDTGALYLLVCIVKHGCQSVNVGLNL